MSNDLVIDHGFTVLNDFDPADAGDRAEPLPRAPFASYADALALPSPAARASLSDDCAAVFTARTKEDSDGYSSGATYFLPCAMRPRCALEALARTIFQAHVDTLGERECPGAKGEKGEKRLLYDPERSGAEWWTLVLDTPSDGAPSNSDGHSDEEEEDDEVGIHFDADYGLEEQLPNYTLHPRVATITYFSDTGVPTLILDKRSPPPSDPEKKALNGHVHNAWLSHPRLGKHVAFDGRFLHGGPGEYFPSVAATSNECSEPTAKKRKVEGSTAAPGGNGKRTTFMVNIWLNHCPIESEPLDEDVIADLKTPWEDTQEGDNNKGNLKVGDPVAPPFEWKVTDIAQTDSFKNTASLARAAEEAGGPAGVEDCVICNRHVDITFGASMEAFHNVSRLAAEEGSMPFVMEDGVVTLKVGDPVSSDEEEEEDP